MSQPTCKDRLPAEYKHEIARVRELWELYKQDPEASTEDGDNWLEYGLAFDYVAPSTFNGQRRGYFRYQISTGGPADEFRFFCDERMRPVRIEYWFLDWFDGAHKVLKGKDAELLTEIFEDLREIGTVQAVFDNGMEYIA